jgi:hypothetical protein
MPPQLQHEDMRVYVHAKHINIIGPNPHRHHLIILFITRNERLQVLTLSQTFTISNRYPPDVDIAYSSFEHTSFT